jgi:hypothetical protein
MSRENPLVKCASSLPECLNHIDGEYGLYEPSTSCIFRENERVFSGINKAAM